MRERAKTGARTKNARGGEREWERKEGTTDNPFFKNRRGRWRPQYSDWPVLVFPSKGHSLLAV